MLGIFKKLFNRKEKRIIKEVENSNIKLEEEQSFDVPKLNWTYEPDKINILVMDDNNAITSMIKQELIDLCELLNYIKDSDIPITEMSYSNQQMFKELDYDNIKERLSKIDIKCSLNIVSVATEMAAFVIHKAIKEENFKTDFAILDIIIGGVQYINNNVKSLDGIDILAELLKKIPNLRYYFYSGCTLGKYSEESVKYRELIDANGRISQYLIGKDEEIIQRRKLLLLTLIDLLEIKDKELKDGITTK